MHDLLLKGLFLSSYGAQTALKYCSMFKSSFTLERVRRLIEEDLELEKYALDVHKRSIKLILEKLMENAAADGDPKDSQENLEKDASLTKQEKEVLESPKKQVIKKDIKEPALDEAEMDDSPIMGVMSSKSESVDAPSVKASESSIKKAIWERAAHFRDNSEYVSFIASWSPFYLLQL
ncbi:hypothetical protein MTR67_047535 [Solanum verrucosum]|uniref:Uncharacterized protein n=1 Tax=Solanum verrucosum TaxID=315347 RepID=A0AAF0UY03_SOLVR|nr:hypothetical protein MTR67_047535 [Solanum verrucosum]